MGEEASKALPVLLPVIGAVTVLLLLAWQPWRRKKSIETGQWRGHWAAPLAFALAFVIAFVVMEGSRGFQLKDRWHVMLPITGIAGAVGIVVGLWRPGWWVRAVLAVIVAIAAGWYLRTPASFEQPLLWKGILAAGVLLSWLNLEMLAARRPGPLIPLALIVVFTALSIVLVESYQAKFSLLAASMAACAGVILIMTMFNRAISLASGGTSVIAAVLSSMALIWWPYSREAVGAAPFGLIWATPAALWIAELPGVRRRRPWLSGALGLAGVGILAAAAVVQAIRAKQG